MSFAFIEAEKASFPISRMCRVLDISQSGFFAWRDRPACQRQKQDMVHLAHIRTVFALSNGTYGSPRMHRDLIDEGHQIGRHRTARLMRENGLVARQKRRFKRTTDSEHAWPVAPNLIAQDFAADAPDKKWGADISYIWTAQGWLYALHDQTAKLCQDWGAILDSAYQGTNLDALRQMVALDFGVAILPAIYTASQIDPGDPSVRVLPFKVLSVWRSIGLVSRSSLTDTADCNLLADVLRRVAARDFASRISVEG